MSQLGVEGARFYADRSVGEVTYLSNLLKLLVPEHRAALTWFSQNAGLLCHSPASEGDRPRIGKVEFPVYSERHDDVISIRVNRLFRRQNGFWCVSLPMPAATSFKSEKFKNLHDRKLPVGIYNRAKGAGRNGPFVVAGVALITEIRNGNYWFDSFDSSGCLYQKLKYNKAERAQNAALFSMGDRRERMVAERVQRAGQASFRKLLVDAYGGKCAISGTDENNVLEAAHILPHLGRHPTCPEWHFVKG